MQAAVLAPSQNPQPTPLFPELGPIADEPTQVAHFRRQPALSAQERASVLETARSIASTARQASSIMSAENIMAVYKLSTQEGRMIMELAEALLRVPDKKTRDFLLFDKLAPGHWLAGDAQGFMRGMKSALALAGGMVRHHYDEGLRAALLRLGVPTVRRAIEAAMRQMGGQFVFAETIEQAAAKAAKSNALFSFDMLGEAARSVADCDRYFDAYAQAIETIAAQASHADVNQNSGVSVKLSALSCRFQPRYWASSRQDLIDRVTRLALAARRHNLPLIMDAEECSRLSPSLAVLEALLAHPELNGWPGLGIVVQAYARHAGAVIDWLERKAREQETRIAVRLVKGAYWDTEIKIAQEKGLVDFPVYTAKNHTDLAYLAHTKRLMAASRYFHPQFASHNAHTLVAVAQLAETIKPQSFELQKLHGMGDAVHQRVAQITAAPLRVYAPVGRHHDLLAYLVRRILENGSSASFMNQFADKAVTLETLVSDPYTGSDIGPALRTGAELFAPERKNSQGFDEDDPERLRRFNDTVAAYSLPARPREASKQAVTGAFETAQRAAWPSVSPSARATILNRIADEYEQAAERIYPLLVHEAGKTIDDAAGELREAVDFCRYYAMQTQSLNPKATPRGTVVAISPWNFPLAIFTGQIVAALGAGNAVIAKPAEQTPRIAALAVSLMHRASVPEDALQLLCGDGESLGAALVAAGRAGMVVFTGSTQTAKQIEQAIARSARPATPLIAETGGLNAMIVDSSALMERAVDDILSSAFRSAGQRCSALRMLYLQEAVAADLTALLCQAADALKVGDPAQTDSDIGTVIDLDAKTRIDNYLEQARRAGRLIWQGAAPESGYFCPPSIVKVSGIADLEEEIFGPVLHLATYKAGEEAAVVDAINRSGYGLTFGMHSRIDANIEAASAAIQAGNVYINRNQIGAVVGSQPFGGHGLSGTGPKAGGALYLSTFLAETGTELAADSVAVDLPGPSGEQNRYEVTHRAGKVLALHPDAEVREALTRQAARFGNRVEQAETVPESLDAIAVVVTRLDDRIEAGALRNALSMRSSRIIPLVTDAGGEAWLLEEKHICRDSTASGGNIELLTG